MKNRLQLRYHIPESLPTREGAMEYLKEAFHNGFKNTAGNASLPAEPLVILYNDTLLDVNNGITEAKRLETSNALLAIGRGGDGINKGNNIDYFVIDFAKHSEEIAENIKDIAKHNENLIKNNEDIEKHGNDIADLMSHKEYVLEFVNYINESIEDFKLNIQNNSEEIASILSKIGDKSDSDKADTIYGYVNLLEKNVDIERERAEDAEDKLSNDIDKESIRSTSEEKRIEDKLDVEIQRAKDKEYILKTDLDKTNINLTDEVKRSTSEEKRIEDKLDAEIDRAKTSEHNEHDRAFKAEGDLNKRIDTLSSATNSEISIAKKSLNDDLTAEIQRAKDNEGRIETSLNSEISNRENADNALDTKFSNLITLIEKEIENNGNKIIENKVNSDNKTIIINSTPETGTNIDVNIDNKTIVKNESGILSVSSSALVQYEGENAISVSNVIGSTKTVSLNINPNDNILINDENGLLSVLTLKWVKSDSENKKDEIQLIGKNNKIISSIDVADFIKDGMLDSVRLDSNNPDSPVLIFTFNSASGKETLNVNVKDLVDVYHAGNGINKTDNVFSVLIDQSSEEFINVSEYGVKLHGIKNAIINSKNEVLAVLELDRSNNTSIQNQLSTSLTNEISERKEKNTEIINAYKKADADIIAAYKEADASIITSYTNSDTILRNELNNSLKTTSERLDNFITGNTILSDSMHYTDDAINAENIRAISAETELNALITKEKERVEGVESDIKQSITDESNRAISAETILTKSIDDEKQRALNAETELNTLIGDEQKRAEEVETNLTVLINDETVRAINAETELTTKINVINGNATENGSIKRVIYESFANNDPLITKVIDSNGNVSIFSSNKTEKILHGDDVLSGVIEGIKKDIDLLIGEDNDISTNITGIHTQISTNTGNISKLSDDLNGEINNRVNAINEVKESIKENTSGITTNYTNISNINNSISIINDSINSINERIDNVDSNVNTLESKVDGLESSIESTVTTQITTLQETISSLQSIISGLTEEINTLREELNELKSKAFTSILGTDNEIDVVISGNTATIKFADDAYFVAGEQ